MDVGGDLSVNWTTVMVALCSGVAAIVAVSLGGFKELVRTWFEIAEARLRKRYANGVKKVALMYRVIEDAKRLSYIHRILLMTGRNCGGIPQPPRAFHVNAFFGWSQKDGFDPSQLYNFDVQADVNYMTVLQQLIKDGWVQQTTATMPDDSMLKSFYVQEGVVDSRLYFLTIDPNTRELHFCSFANYEREFTTSERHHMNHLAQRLRSLLQLRDSLL